MDLEDCRRRLPDRSGSSLVPASISFMHDCKMREPYLGRWIQGAEKSPEIGYRLTPKSGFPLSAKLPRKSPAL